MTTSAHTISSPRIRTSTTKLLDAVNRCHRLAKEGPRALVELRTAPGQPIHCRACDGSAGIDVVVPAASDTSEVVVLDSATFLKALKACAKGSVDLQVEDDRTLCITDENGFSVRIWICEGEQIPASPKRTAIEATGTIAAEVDFPGVLRNVASHATKDETRFNIYAVYFEHDGERVYVCATNGHRMALSVRKFSWPEIKGVTILPQIPGLLPTNGGDLTVTVCAKTVFFESAIGITLWTRRSQGKFPPFRSVIPNEVGKKGTRMITVEREAFFKATTALDKIRSNPSASTEVHCSNNRLELETQGDVHEQPIGSQSLPFLGSPPCEHRISLNVAYLDESAAVLEDKRIRLYWTGPIAPFVLSDRPGNDAYNLVVVMPVRH